MPRRAGRRHRFEALGDLEQDSLLLDCGLFQVL